MQVWGILSERKQTGAGPSDVWCCNHPSSFRSRILDGLVAPSTPTLSIKIPLPLTLHGAKRVPRTQSSLNRRQRGCEMYLSDHLPRRGKPPRLQLLTPAGAQGHLVRNFLEHTSCIELSRLAAITCVWRCFVRGLDSYWETPEKH